MKTTVLVTTKEILRLDELEEERQCRALSQEENSEYLNLIEKVDRVRFRYFGTENIVATQLLR